MGPFHGAHGVIGPFNGVITQQPLPIRGCIPCCGHLCCVECCKTRRHLESRVVYYPRAALCWVSDLYWLGHVHVMHGTFESLSPHDQWFNGPMGQLPRATPEASCWPARFTPDTPGTSDTSIISSRGIAVVHVYASVRSRSPWHTMPQRLPIPRCLRDLWTCVGLHVLTVRPHMTSHVHHIMPSYLLWHNTRGGIHWVYMGLPAVRLGSAVTCWQYGAEMVAVRDDVTQAGTEKHRDEGYDTWPLLGKVCEYNRM